MIFIISDLQWCLRYVAKSLSTNTKKREIGSSELIFLVLFFKIHYEENEKLIYGQSVHEKMLNTVHHSGNATLSHREISHNIHCSGYNKRPR